jgi:hypothetical protein
MNAIEKVKRHIKAGCVYRREELGKWSNAIDRHLDLLQKDNTLKKLSGGLYYCPEHSVFGAMPPSEETMIRAFLKDNRFLLMSFNHYNSLGIGTTQLYNEAIVYNHKRHGVFQLGTRTYRFIRKRYFPIKLSEEFLLVDLVDNIKRLVEDQPQILELVKTKALKLNHRRLLEFAKKNGSARTKFFFTNLFKSKFIAHDRTVPA